MGWGDRPASCILTCAPAGKSVGVVTTTRVQHASPAGTYAHTVNRNWYSDANMPESARQEGCQDTSVQLISNMDIDVREGLREGREAGRPPPPRPLQGPSDSGWGRYGSRSSLEHAFWRPDPSLIPPALMLPQVILGGGRKYMFPEGTPDPEYPFQKGTRLDGRNLVEEWLSKHQVKDWRVVPPREGRSQAGRGRDRAGGGRAQQAGCRVQ